jgi:hypothetical protein
VESEHFLLQTDLPIEEARKAASYLERTRGALLAAAWPAASQREMARVTVYVFGKDSDFENLFPRRIDGLFSLQGNEPSSSFMDARTRVSSASRDARRPLPPRSSTSCPTT